MSVYALLKDRAQATPEAIAMVAPGREPLTYGRLLAAVDGAVDALNEFGVGRNSRVAIVLPNGPEMALAFLAVSACATSMPLNPAYRARELDALLAQLRASALIVPVGFDTPAVAVAREHGIPVIRLAPRPEAAAGVFALEGAHASPPVSRGPSSDDDVALILSTSGTTARSKVVPLTHANICASARSVAAALELTAADRCLNVMPLFHIHGLIGALLSSLAMGGSVICRPGFHAPSALGWLEELGPTWYTAVPTIHQAILDRAAAAREALARCRLRLVRSCSAPLPARVMTDLEDAFQAPVIEAYGMTEAAHQITSNLLPPRQRKARSVGVPIGVELAVVSPAGKPVPRGGVGEVVIRGPSVMAGYEDDPAANGSSRVAGWLKTGDQGYLDDDGYLFLTGRLKEMINRAGTKIAPAEVDDVLLDHPAVAGAVTFSIPHPTLGEEVAAAVVLKPDAYATERDIREFSAGRLADFKVPSRVLVVDEIPKGPTGKVQRTGLAQRLGLAPSGPPRLPRTEFVAPDTALEKSLAQMWREVLGVQRISLYDDFFDVGGDSLLATELFLRVREELRVGMSLTQLFEVSTLAGQALTIGRSQRGVAPSSSVAIQSAGSRPPFFCVVAGTDIAFLRNLGILFERDQPFYALYPGDLARAHVRYSPERAVSEYVREIRAVQPEGPYFLGGWCAGSGVALEVGRRLVAQGHRVALLALVAPVVHYARDHSLRSYWQRLSLLPRGERLPKLLGTLRGLGDDVAKKLRATSAPRSESAPLSVARSQAEISWTAQVANRAALGKYTRKAYPGRVTLFVTTDLISGAAPAADPRIVFGRLARGGLDVHVVSGTHTTIVHRPHVESLARQLRQCLDEAMEPSSALQEQPGD